MARKEPTFVEQLLALKAGNIFQGLAIGAQADMMRRQDTATLKTMEKFNANLNEFEGGTRTTDEQIKQLEESTLFKESSTKLTEQAANFKALLDKQAEDELKLNQVYDVAVQEMGMIGSQESLQMAEILSKQKGTKLELFHQKLQNLKESIDFQRSMLDIEQANLNIKTKEFELGMLRENKEVNDLYAQMLSVLEPEWTKVLNKLFVNRDTGNIMYKSEYLDFSKKAFSMFGKDKQFGNVMRLIQDYITQNRDFYDPPDIDTGSIGDISQLYDRHRQVMGLYKWLQDMTRFTSEIEFQQSPELTMARNLYIKYDAENNRKSPVFSDPTIIDKVLKDPLTDGTTIAVTSEGGAQNRLNLSDALYKYYNLKHNLADEKNYWNQYNLWKRSIGAGDQRFSPIVKRNAGELVMKNGKILLEDDYKKANQQIPYKYKVDPQGRLTYAEEYFEQGTFEMPTPEGKLYSFDLTSIMSDEEGYYNPYDPETTTHYSSTSRKFIRTEIKKKESEDQKFMREQSEKMMQGALK